jgi:hypothetical protein
MNTSRWYKEFGGGREVRYYHITGELEQTRIPVTLYVYDTLLRRISHRESLSFDTKRWMEQVLHNVVHEVPESSVPFLMAV